MDIIIIVRLFKEERAFFCDFSILSQFQSMLNYSILILNIDLRSSRLERVFKRATNDFTFLNANLVERFCGFHTGYFWNLIGTSRVTREIKSIKKNLKKREKKRILHNVFAQTWNFQNKGGKYKKSEKESSNDSLLGCSTIQMFLLFLVVGCLECKIWDQQ